MCSPDCQLTFGSEELIQRIKIPTQSSCKLATAVASRGADNTNSAIAAMTLQSSIPRVESWSLAG